MTNQFALNLKRALLTCLAAGALMAMPASIGGSLQSAQAQVSVSVEFRTALDPHGRWHRHSRWGEVWIPARVERDWRPYQRGRWVYNDDWGWYWVSNEDFGWVTYHYGRWVFDSDLGWVWVPGREWAPAWVLWRRGAQQVGWAPLPPDEIIVEYREQPDVWVFVRMNDFTAPRIATVLLPPQQQPIFFRDTVLVNRTYVTGSGATIVAVNPGIAPSIVAAAIGQPIQTYTVQPRVIAGTTRVRGAVEVTAQELQSGQATRQTAATEVKETQQTVKPADNVPEPKELAAEEKGRLGENPPRAAQAEASGEQKGEARQAEENRQGETGTTTGRAAEGEKAGEAAKGREAQQEQREQRQQQQREAADEKQRKQRQDREARDKQQRDQDAAGKKAADQKGDAASTTGKASDEAREQSRPQRGKAGDAKDRGGNAREKAREAAQERQRQQQRKAPETEGRSPAPAAERGADKPPAQKARPEQRSAPAKSPAPQQQQQQQRQSRSPQSAPPPAAAQRAPATHPATTGAAPPKPSAPPKAAAPPQPQAKPAPAAPAKKEN